MLSTNEGSFRQYYRLTQSLCRLLNRLQLDSTA